MNHVKMTREEIEALCLAKRNGRGPTFPRILVGEKYNPKTGQYEEHRSAMLGNCTTAELEAHWAANPHLKAEWDAYHGKDISK